MKNQIRIEEFILTNKDYFKNKPVEQYEQYLTDLENCVYEAFEITSPKEPTPPDEQGMVVFATGGINWLLVADMMNGLSLPFFEGIEFV